MIHAERSSTKTGYAMRYLIYLPVPKDITDMLDNEPDERVYPPPSGYHITVCVLFDMKKERETELNEKISTIVPSQFALNITDVKTFRKTAEQFHVLVTSRPFELYKFHMRMIRILSSLETDERMFTETSRTLWGCWYVPHITFGTSNDSPKLVHDYIGRTFPVTHIGVKKKIGDGAWRQVMTHSLFLLP
jgi:2'-5' RNA ligase